MGSALALGPDRALSRPQGYPQGQSCARRCQGRTAWQRKSPLEERFGPFLRNHRLPPCRFNDSITVGDRTFHVDCHWPDTNQIVELDGWQAHKSRSAFREDKARDRRLAAAGYTVTHLTWNQLDDEPDEIASDLRVLLGIDR